MLEAAFEETGRKTLYAVNLTGRTMELKSKARKAAELGADVLLHCPARQVDGIQRFAPCFFKSCLKHFFSFRDSFFKGGTACFE